MSEVEGDASALAAGGAEGDAWEALVFMEDCSGWIRRHCRPLREGRSVPESCQAKFDFVIRTCFPGGMAKQPRKTPPPPPIRSVMFAMRLTAEEREALDIAAAKEDRTASSLARKIVLDWLREHG